MAAPTKKVFEIFVSKVPWTLANKEMKEYFGQFGQIRKCLLPFLNVQQSQNGPKRSQRDDS